MLCHHQLKLTRDTNNGAISRDCRFDLVAASITDQILAPTGWPLPLGVLPTCEKNLIGQKLPQHTVRRTMPHGVSQKISPPLPPRLGISFQESPVGSQVSRLQKLSTDNGKLVPESGLPTF